MQSLLALIFSKWRIQQNYIYAIHFNLECDNESLLLVIRNSVRWKFLNLPMHTIMWQFPCIQPTWQ